MSGFLSDRQYVDETEFDKYPVDIDFSRIHITRDDKPSDWWNYKEYEGKWYNRERDNHLVGNRCHLRRLRREMGVHFRTWQDFDIFVEKEVSKPCYFYCSMCKDFKTEEYNRLESHMNNRMCKIAQKRLEAEKNKETYIPDSKKPAYCGLCKLPFSTKYTLELHKKSQAHKDNLSIDSLPSKCLVCKYSFDLEKHAKVRRHLKSAKKCHSLVRDSPAKRADYLWMHSRFRCKFPQNIFDKPKLKPKIKVV